MFQALARVLDLKSEPDWGWAFVHAYLQLTKLELIEKWV